MVRTRAAISTGVSPLARRATAKPAIWEAVAPPSRIVASARPASSGARSSPRMSLASRTGQRVSASVDIAQRAYPSTGAVPGWGAATLGAAAALAEHPAALPLGEAAPHTVLLPGGQGELHAGLAYGAHAAD